MLEAFVQQLWEASQERRVCRISLKKEPFPRLIHPYGVCQSSSKKIILVCRQVAGFTKTGRTEGYRNLIFDKIESLEITDKKFQFPNDFNPSDPQYDEWVFHIDIAPFG